MCVVDFAGQYEETKFISSKQATLRQNRKKDRARSRTMMRSGMNTMVKSFQEEGDTKRNPKEQFVSSGPGMRTNQRKRRRNFIIKKRNDKGKGLSLENDDDYTNQSSFKEIWPPRGNYPGSVRKNRKSRYGPLQRVGSRVSRTQENSDSIEKLEKLRMEIRLKRKQKQRARKKREKKFRSPYEAYLNHLNRIPQIRQTESDAYKKTRSPESNKNLSSMAISDIDFESEWLPGAKKCYERSHIKKNGDAVLQNVVRIFEMDDGSKEVVEWNVKEILQKKNR